MSINVYTNRRILSYRNKMGYSALRIAGLLQEGLCVSHPGIANFFACVKTTSTIAKKLIVFFLVCMKHRLHGYLVCYEKEFCQCEFSSSLLSVAEVTHVHVKWTALVIKAV